MFRHRNARVSTGRRLIALFTAAVFYMLSLSPNPGDASLKASPAVPILDIPEFSSEDLTPYTRDALSARNISSWDGIILSGLSILQTNWESAVDQQIEAYVNSVDTSDEIHDNEEYRKYIQDSLELQRSQGFSNWIREAEAAIQDERDVFLSLRSQQYLSHQDDQTYESTLDWEFQQASYLADRESHFEISPSTVPDIFSGARDLLEMEQIIWQRDFNDRLDAGIYEYSRGLNDLQQERDDFHADLDAAADLYQRNLEYIENLENAVRDRISTSLTDILQGIYNSHQFYDDFRPMGDCGEWESANCETARAIHEENLTAEGLKLRDQIQSLQASLSEEMLLSEVTEQMAEILAEFQETAEQRRNQWEERIEGEYTLAGFETGFGRTTGSALTYRTGWDSGDSIFYSGSAPSTVTNRYYENNTDHYGSAYIAGESFSSCLGYSSDSRSSSSTSSDRPIFGNPDTYSETHTTVTTRSRSCSSSTNRIGAHLEGVTVNNQHSVCTRHTSSTTTEYELVPGTDCPECGYDGKGSYRATGTSSSSGCNTSSTWGRNLSHLVGKGNLYTKFRETDTRLIWQEAEEVDGHFTIQEYYIGDLLEAPETWDRSIGYNIDWDELEARSRIARILEANRSGDLSHIFDLALDQGENRQITELKGGDVCGAGGGENGTGTDCFSDAGSHGGRQNFEHAFVYNSTSVDRQTVLGWCWGFSCDEYRRNYLVHSQTSFSTGLTYEFYDAAAEENYNTWSSYHDQVASEFDTWMNTLLPSIQNWEAQRAEFEVNHAAWQADARQQRQEMDSWFEISQAQLLASRDTYMQQMEDRRREGLRQWEIANTNLNQTERDWQDRVNQADWQNQQIQNTLRQELNAELDTIFSSLPERVELSLQVNNELEALRRNMPQLMNDFLQQGMDIPDTRALMNLVEKFSRSATAMMNMATADSLNGAFDALRNESLEMAQAMLADYTLDIGENEGLCKGFNMCQSEFSYQDVEIRDGQLIATRSILSGDASLRSGASGLKAYHYDPVFRDQSVEYGNNMAGSVVIGGPTSIFERVNHAEGLHSFLTGMQDYQRNAMEGLELFRRELIDANRIAGNNISNYADSVGNAVERAENSRPSFAGNKLIAALVNMFILPNYWGGSVNINYDADNGWGASVSVGDNGIRLGYEWSEGGGVTGGNVSFDFEAPRKEGTFSRALNTDLGKLYNRMTGGLFSVVGTIENAMRKPADLFTLSYSTETGASLSHNADYNNAQIGYRYQEGYGPSVSITQTNQFDYGNYLSSGLTIGPDGSVDSFYNAGYNAPQSEGTVTDFMKSSGGQVVSGALAVASFIPVTAPFALGIQAGLSVAQAYEAGGPEALGAGLLSAAANTLSRTYTLGLVGIEAGVDYSAEHGWGGSLGLSVAGQQFIRGTVYEGGVTNTQLGANIGHGVNLGVNFHSENGFSGNIGFDHDSLGYSPSISYHHEEGLSATVGFRQNNDLGGFVGGSLTFSEEGITDAGIDSRVDTAYTVGKYLGENSRFKSFFEGAYSNSMLIDSRIGSSREEGAYFRNTGINFRAGQENRIYVDDGLENGDLAVNAQRFSTCTVNGVQGVCPIREDGLGPDSGSFQSSDEFLQNRYGCFSGSDCNAAIDSFIGMGMGTNIRNTESVCNAWRTAIQSTGGCVGIENTTGLNFYSGPMNAMGYDVTGQGERWSNFLGSAQNYMTEDSMSYFHSDGTSTYMLAAEQYHAATGNALVMGGGVESIHLAGTPLLNPILNSRPFMYSAEERLTERLYEAGHTDNHAVAYAYGGDIVADGPTRLSQLSPKFWEVGTDHFSTNYSTRIGEHLNHQNNPDYVARALQTKQVCASVFNTANCNTVEVFDSSANNSTKYLHMVRPDVRSMIFGDQIEVVGKQLEAVNGRLEFLNRSAESNQKFSNGQLNSILGIYEDQARLRVLSYQLENQQRLLTDEMRQLTGDSADFARRQQREYTEFLERQEQIRELRAQFQDPEQEIFWDGIP